ncbi:MAG: hypothetical protein NTW28_31405 [Candidatus Solibacter sp.]|nr:hypothetical protein [Candidatus Solibacter sp.]
MEELHGLLSCGIRFLVARKLHAWQVDDCVREVFDRVVRGIQSGDLGNPVRLVQYVRMHLTTHIREIQDQQMPGHTADSSSLPCVTDEHRQVMQDLLLCLSPNERESMDRFFVQGHDDRRICRELRVPAAEFRSLRSRVKARFHELCPQGAVGVG